MESNLKYVTIINKTTMISVSVGDFHVCENNGSYVVCNNKSNNGVGGYSKKEAEEIIKQFKMLDLNSFNCHFFINISEEGD